MDNPGASQPRGRAGGREGEAGGWGAAPPSCASLGQVSEGGMQAEHRWAGTTQQWVGLLAVLDSLQTMVLFTGSTPLFGCDQAATQAADLSILGFTLSN